MKAFVERRLTRETSFLLFVFALISMLYALSSIAYESHLGLWPAEVLTQFSGSELLLVPPVAWKDLLFHLHLRLFLEIMVLLLLFGAMAAVGASRAQVLVLLGGTLLLLLEIFGALGLRATALPALAYFKQFCFFGSRVLFFSLGLVIAVKLSRLLEKPKP